MFLNYKEVHKQMQPTKISEIGFGDDISNTSNSVQEILKIIEEKQQKLESEQKAQKKLNVAMLVFSVIAALGGLISAVISVLLLF